MIQITFVKNFDSYGPGMGQQTDETRAATLIASGVAVYSQDYNNYTTNNALADEMAELADALDSIGQRLDASENP
jgi:hypothetical protein